MVPNFFSAAYNRLRRKSSKTVWHVLQRGRPLTCESLPNFPTHSCLPMICAASGGGKDLPHITQGIYFPALSFTIFDLTLGLKEVFLRFMVCFPVRRQHTITASAFRRAELPLTQYPSTSGSLPRLLLEDMPPPQNPHEHKHPSHYRYASRCHTP